MGKSEKPVYGQNTRSEGQAMRIVIEDVYLPDEIRGFVWLKDGVYRIFLNDKLEPGQRAHSLAHELAHIRNRDFEKKWSLDKIEQIAHRR